MIQVRYKTDLGLMGGLLLGNLIDLAFGQTAFRAGLDLLLEIFPIIVLLSVSYIIQKETSCETRHTSSTQG